jgi:hypothetical protein
MHPTLESAHNIGLSDLSLLLDYPKGRVSVGSPEAMIKAHEQTQSGLSQT